MATPIFIQKMGQQMESGTITNWFVKEGDYVYENDPLFSMETDKVIVEVPAPATGIIKIVHDESRDELPIGEVVAYINEEKEQSDNPISDSLTTRSSKQRIIASPYARKLSRENNVDLSEIKGTSSNGRIIAQDVRQHIKSQNKEKDSKSNNKELPLTSMRKKIANLVEQSARSIVPVTITKTLRADKLVQLRKELKQEGIFLSPNDFMIYAVSRSLDNHRSFNSVFSVDRINQYNDINIGFAVAINDGVIMPVIHQADKKSINKIAMERKRLIEDMRNHRIKNENLVGGTFSISSLGSYGMESFSPVVHPTQAAILGVGAIEKKPIVEENDQLRVGYVLSLSLVFDHRANDGAPAAQFLNDVCSRIENPLKMIISS